ncbi:zinc finger protein [Macleaya cordata]|uniref:Zinc finger protein n=1 Tax=Macleaya cordata TaxID=56857 RepID=A0A200Q720_MACCD|nr:zinc finger protein [Macleaya cordata]
MLHQTLTLSFQFNPYSSSSSSATATLPSPSYSSLQVKLEMECVEAKALKTSFWPEMNVKSAQQVVTDDLLCGNNGTNCVFGDDSFVDEFLDFSKEDVHEDGFVEEEEEEKDCVEEEEEKDCVSVSSQEQNSNSSGFSVQDEFGSPPSSELCVPADDLADLEWLSNFVDDSFTEFSFPFPAGNPQDKTQAQTPKQNRSCFGPVSGISSLKTSNFPTPVPPKRSRTKRSRTNGRVWSLGSPSFSESSSSSSSSSSSPTSCLIFTNRPQNLDFLYYIGNPPEKKQKKKSVTETQPQRRCSHCGVQKTPQWRTGPLGAKTLCNACGVRYKSGRLLPEYRPACSPTFSSDVHSNNHRKVLEMRRKKEITPPESGLTPVVHSF